jgi:hypothetical protein
MQQHNGLEISPFHSRCSEQKTYRRVTESCPTPHYRSTIERYPSWSVVACVLLTANPSIYPTVYKSIARGWREKEMIQPHPLV